MIDCGVQFKSITSVILVLSLFVGCSQNTIDQESEPITMPSFSPDDLADAIEFYHAGLDHYFITAAPNEISDLDNGIHEGWVRTGLSFNVILPGSEALGSNPVCRFYGKAEAGLDSHFYSASPQECQEVMDQFADSWQFESDEVFRAYLPDSFTGNCPAGTFPVYRLWNNRQDSNHRYTTDLAIFDQMRTLGYIAEGYGNSTHPVALCAPASGFTTGNFDIDSGQQFSGHYNSMTHLCNVTRSITSQAIYVNGYEVCSGFGPGVFLRSANFISPTPTPTPTTTPTPTPTPTPPVRPPTQPTTGPFTCGSSFIITPYMEKNPSVTEMTFTNERFVTRDFDGSSVAVSTIRVPMGVSGSSRLQVYEYVDTKTDRRIWLSKSRCDMSGSGPAYSSGKAPTIYIRVGGNTAAQNEVLMQPGETWYLMVKNEVDLFGQVKSSCPSSESHCNVGISLHTILP